jgi:hypothetical protein
MTTTQVLTTLRGLQVGLDVHGNLVLNKADGSQVILDGKSVRYDQALNELVTNDGIVITALAVDPALAAQVARQINNATANFVVKGSSINNLALVNSSGANLLSGDNITDPTTGLTVTQALAAIRASILPGGVTAPVPNAAPSLSFPGGTGDLGETVTITPGTYTGSTPTSVVWQVVSNGAIVQTVSSGTTFIITAAMVTGARALSVTELFTWSGGTNQIGKTSATATLNAPPASPVITTPPSWGNGTPQVGTVFTVNAGTATNSPTSIVLSIYSGWVSPTNRGTVLTTLSGTGTYTIQASDAGATLVIGEVATNAQGSSSVSDPNSFSSSIVIATGAAPQWVDTTGNPLAGAVLPAFTQVLYAPGDTLMVDLGTTVGNASPSGYSYQILRDGSPGSPVGMPSATNVSAISYVATSTDNGHVISATVTASNGGGVSLPVTIAGVFVEGVGGSTGVLSGSVSTVPDNTTGTPYVLSTIGSKDWWSSTGGTFLTPDTKSGGPARISVSAVAGTEANGGSSHTNYWMSWTSGTPNATGNSDGYRQVTNAGAACDIQIVVTGMSTTTDTITLYFDIANNETISIVASLSDGSAPNWTYNASPGNYNVQAVITAKAASPSQTLTIHLKNLTGYAAIAFEAVTIG